MRKMTWVIEDHICRNCSGGRILRCVSGAGPTGGGNPIYKCADCGTSTSSMGPDSLCWCGMSFKNQHLTEYMCLPFSILKEKPHLRNAFLSCGCDPSCGEVGIVTKKSYRNAEEAASCGQDSATENTSESAKTSANTPSMQLAEPVVE